MKLEEEKVYVSTGALPSRKHGFTSIMEVVLSENSNLDGF